MRKPAVVTVKVLRENPPSRKANTDDEYEAMYDACVDVFQRQEVGAWYRIAEIRGGASTAAHSRIKTLKRKHPEIEEFHQLKLRGSHFKAEGLSRIYAKWAPPSKSLGQLRDITGRGRRRRSTEEDVG